MAHHLAHHLAQELIQNEYPNITGWVAVSTVLAQNDGFSRGQSLPEETIQIHTVSGSHWVMSGTRDEEVTVWTASGWRVA